MTEFLKPLLEGYRSERLINLMRRIAPFKREEEDENYKHLIKEGWPFDTAKKLGVIELSDVQKVVVADVHSVRELSSRSGKKMQFELGKRILKAGNYNAGIFAFYDNEDRFRLSLITTTYHGTRRAFSSYRRHTFFVDPALPNKTFVQQLSRAHFSSLEKILEAFSLEAVSDAFYQEFKPKYEAIAEAVVGTTDKQLKQDFALLFVIRVIFLGFVQKKGWLGDNPRFLQDFWREYQDSNQPQNTFYREWLMPLFFEALSSSPGRKVAYGKAPFSEATQKALQMAPYLNGELFKRKTGVDNQELWIPDALIGDFFDFLFQYNFTVEENDRYDEELELNPEFLGIIFERITNMDQGAVYTPRVEVDLMCRLALVKWLEQSTGIRRESLYQLFFSPEDSVTLSPEEIRTLIEKLVNVTVCDPAAGSGAFEVGMLQVLDRTLEDLYNHTNTPAELKQNAPSPYERKKAIIARSLYGVEVKRWAVWINHLRLWLTLFVDMPDDLKNSEKPLLPNLTFKVRMGDSLVQRIGDHTFPIQENVNLSESLNSKVEELKQKKRDYFYNRTEDDQSIKEKELELFQNSLMAAIEERKKAIKKLEQPTPSNGVLFEELAMQEAERAFQEKQKKEALIAALRAEIANLESLILNLKEEHPFIWSLEFAEIFFTRGGFDIIIGNPPYVRQEKIADPNGIIPPDEYKDALLEMLRLDFPDYFAKSRAYIDQFKKGRKPSKRSDLYTYFYIRSLLLLNPQGVHVFICSNAWLDVGYGTWLQEFFLRRVPLYLVIDNHAKRSFVRADVNTIITVASAPLPWGETPNDHVVRFVAFKNPFEEVVNADNFITIENTRKILKTSDFRVYPITVKELLEEGSEHTFLGPGKYIGDKWGGKYLRAPDIYSLQYWRKAKIG